MVALLIVAAFVLLVWWVGFTKSGKAFAEQSRRQKEAREPKRISQVGVKGAAGLACPKCGGTQFKVRRKTSTKLALGAVALLGQARWVRCVTCGAQYRRD